MTLTASDARAIALDLPCIGDSTGPLEGGSKRELAALVHTLVDNLGLTDVTLVGHDVGGMVAYSYLRQYDDVARVVILDTVIPGVDPWNEVVRNPNIWHFAFHAIASLASARAGPPNRLLRVLLRRAVRRSDKAHPEARREYAAASRTDTALTAGFDFYRAFPRDAEDNIAFSDGASVDTPRPLRARGRRGRPYGDLRERATRRWGQQPDHGRGTRRRALHHGRTASPGMADH
jgi:pimeloyl-ACP methyl ester carboxylesterase